MKKGIIIIDFGSQYNKLIARRIREMSVYSEILPCSFKLVKEIKKLNPSGIILSGGPSSVNTKNSYSIEKEIYELGIPILGICYGMQLTIHIFGGKVSRGNKAEYGKSEFIIQGASNLFENLPINSIVWMSHFDEVTTLPEDFEIIGISNSSIAAVQNVNKKIYTLQFHPEVSHSEFGQLILKNFVLNICKAPKKWVLNDFISQTIKQIQQIVGKEKVILGLSGGVDSSVASVLIHRSIGDQLTCIFVDTGLLRKDEVQKVIKMYKDYFDFNIKIHDASDQFLNHLIGIDDPEKKRKQIGKDFIEVFSQEAKKIQNAKFLAQGTIYPDIIESKSVKGPSEVIKSHHNVGGLPEGLKFRLLEPLKELFKDEVRKVGLELGLPYDVVYRHPFPGPGLGIRILGVISKEKVEILKKADDILIEELHTNKLYYHVNQAFVVLLPIKSVGIMGDERSYEYTAVIRCVNTIDFMTATWSKLPYEFLEKVSNRIINEVIGINRVVYDISSKPPATIEWE